MSARETKQGELLLAVDTALGACSVAVLRGDEILAHHFEEMARGHAEALAPMVERAMRKAGIAFTALDRLAVTTGPGTFTGQRVGLSFMRGLRIGLDRPLTGITTLEAMAAATGLTRAAAIHDARRDEAYLLLWENGASLLPPTILPFADAVARIRAFGACALCGTGAGAAGEALGAEFPTAGIHQPDALWVARLAMTRAAPKDAPAPLYLRAPDAKLPGSSGQKKWEPASAGEPVFRPAPEAPIEQLGAFAPGAVRPKNGPAMIPRLFDPAADDAEVLARLHAACFAQAWSAASVRELLAGPGVFAFTVPEGVILARAAGGEAEILTLAVATPARRRGLARALVRAAAAHAALLGAGAIFLEVATDNPGAIRLYEGLGFALAGRRKAYYGSDDAHILKGILPLPNPDDFA